MASATVTSKGQVTIPADIRSAFAIASGDQLVFYRDLAGDLRLHVRKPESGAGRATLSAGGRHVPVGDMDPGGVLDAPPQPASRRSRAP